MDYTVMRLFRSKVVAVSLVLLLVVFAGCASNMSSVQGKDAEAPPAPRKISSIAVTEAPGTATVVVRGNGPLTYTSVKQPSPLGVILYLPETMLDLSADPALSGGDVIRAVNASQLTDNGNAARIEIALTTDVVYQVVPVDAGLKIVLGQPVSAAAAPAAPQPPVETGVASAAPGPSTDGAGRLEGVSAKPTETGVIVTVRADGPIKNYKKFSTENPSRFVFDIMGVKSPFKDEQTIPVDSPWVKSVRHFGYPDKIRLVIDTDGATRSQLFEESTREGLRIFVGMPAAASAGQKNAAAVAGSAWVNRIDFSSEPAGKSTILIGTTQAVTYDLKKIGDKTLELQLMQTDIPQYRRRPLITTRFPSAVDLITPRQDAGHVTAMAIELRELVPYFVEQTDNLIMIHFEASSIPPRPFDEARLPVWQKTMAGGRPAGTTAQAAPALQVADEALTAAPAGAVSSVPKSGIKQYNGQKIALDFYDMDIKNVFRILMQVSGKNFAVDKDVSGKVTLSLDTPVPWDQVLALILKMNGLGKIEEGNIIRIATQETLTREDEQLRAKFEAREKARKQVKAVEPMVTEYIAISYSNAKSDILPHLEKIVTKDRGSLSVDERTNQVIMTDTVDKIEQAKQIVRRIDKVTPQVIIEARIVETTTNFSRELGVEWGASGNSASSSLGGDLGWDVGMNLPVNSVGTIGIDFSRIVGSTLALDAQLQAMESLEQGKIVSSPRVVTLDNKKAMIKQGYEFPYQEKDDDGDISIEFKDIDLKLEVTPHITPDNRIALSVHITKNDIYVLTEEAPALTTKEAETELLVNDGDTFVIGGIIKTNSNVTENGVPVLNKIPLFKWLFKNNQESDTKDELLIFITPRIVQLEQREI